jgi:hypothetical protein
VRVGKSPTSVTGTSPARQRRGLDLEVDERQGALDRLPRQGAVAEALDDLGEDGVGQLIDADGLGFARSFRPGVLDNGTLITGTRILL